MCRWGESNPVTFHKYRPEGLVSISLWKQHVSQRHIRWLLATWHVMVSLWSGMDDGAHTVGSVTPAGGWGVMSDGGCVGSVIHIWRRGGAGETGHWLRRMKQLARSSGSHAVMGRSASFLFFFFPMINTSEQWSLTFFLSFYLILKDILALFHRETEQIAFSDEDVVLFQLSPLSLG